MKRLTKLTIASAGILAFTGTTMAIQQAAISGAEEVPPIYTQVEEHEGRIDTLEVRADSTEAKVEQHNAEIRVIQTQTGTAPAAGSNTSAATSSTVSEPVSEPAPAPEPPQNPRLILAVVEGVQGSLRTCDYTLVSPIHDNAVGVIIQPMATPCQKIGEILE